MAFLRVFGKFLISVGVGVLLFAAWTFWGTGLYTGRQQRALEAEFRDIPVIEFEEPTGDGGKKEEEKTPADFEELLADFTPQRSDPIFRLRIPKIDVDDIVVEGVGVEELRKGPGHYPACREEFAKPHCTDFPESFPGEPGRVVVSGHRTTYGAPFWDLDRLETGDEIMAETKWGDFVYRVTRARVVDRNDPTVVVQRSKPEIVLTTCHPRFSASERLVIYASLEEVSA